MNRRSFLKATGSGLTTLAIAPPSLAGSSGTSTPHSPSVQPASRAATVSDVVVVGAGAFGGWTALYLREMGASVTMVDE